MLQLNKLASIGILVLSMRDGLVVLRLDGDLYSGEVQSDSLSDAVAKMVAQVNESVASRVAELESKIERLKAAL